LPQEFDTRLLLEYLYGELDESEEARIEEAYFTDDDFYEQLAAVENDLIDRYVQNTLTESGRREFEEKYLTTPLRHRKVEVSQNLINLIIAAPVALPRAVVRLSRWQTFLAFLRQRNMFLQLSFASALLLMMAGALWLQRERVRLRDELQQTQASLRQKEQDLQRQQAEQDKIVAQLKEATQREQVQNESNEQLLQRLQEQEQSAQKARQESMPHSSAVSPSIATYVFSLEPLRGIHAQKPLVIRREDKSARLIINLKKNSYQRLRVSLQRVAGDEIWSQFISKGRTTSLGERIIVEVPVNIFNKKDYILVVDGVTSDGNFENLTNLSFSVKNENIQHN
jgi:hypothetical protein